MTDFGADEAFGQVPAKLKEHYGIEMPVSTIQRTTEHHAQRIYEEAAAREIGPGTAAGVIFVGELDGSMVPVVEPSPAAEDKRQGKVLSWKEVRLNLVHPQGSVTPMFGGNFAGGVEESGRQWWRWGAFPKSWFKRQGVEWEKKLAFSIAPNDLLYSKNVASASPEQSLRARTCQPL
jgi:hypothetical protein